MSIAVTTLALSITVSREYLGLTPLEVGDAPGYQAVGFLNGAVSYNRETATSPYIDGDVTTHRTLQNVTDPLTVDVFGRTVANGALTPAAMRANEDQLIRAISQAAFTVQYVIDGQVWKYQCEASDFQVTRQGPRQMARQGQIVVQLLRQPVPILGVA